MIDGREGSADKAVKICVHETPCPHLTGRPLITITSRRSTRRPRIRIITAAQAPPDQLGFAVEPAASPATLPLVRVRRDCDQHADEDVTTDSHFFSSALPRLHAASLSTHRLSPQSGKLQATQATHDSLGTALLPSTGVGGREFITGYCACL